MAQNDLGCKKKSKPKVLVESSVRETKNIGKRTAKTSVMPAQKKHTSNDMVYWLETLLNTSRTEATSIERLLSSEEIQELSESFSNEYNSDPTGPYMLKFKDENGLFDEDDEEAVQPPFAFSTYEEKVEYFDNLNENYIHQHRSVKYKKHLNKLRFNTRNNLVHGKPMSPFNLSKHRVQLETRGLWGKPKEKRETREEPNEEKERHRAKTCRDPEKGLVLHRQRLPSEKGQKEKRGVKKIMAI